MRMCDIVNGVCEPTTHLGVLDAPEEKHINVMHHKTPLSYNFHMMFFSFKRKWPMKADDLRKTCPWACSIANCYIDYVRLTIAKKIRRKIRMNPIKKGWTYHKPLPFWPPQRARIWHQGAHWVRLCRMRDMASDIWSAKSLPELDFLRGMSPWAQGGGAPWTKKNGRPGGCCIILV